MLTITQIMACEEHCSSLRCTYLPPKSKMTGYLRELCKCRQFYTSGRYIKDQKVSPGMSYKASKSQ